MKTSDAPVAVATRLKPAQRPQIGLAFAGFTLVGVKSGAFGVLLPSISLYYGVDKSVVGLLFLATTIGYLISAFSSSMLAEKFGLGRFLLFGSALLVTGSLIMAFGPPFWVVLLCNLMMGFGGGIVETGGNFFVTSLPRNTTILNYLHAFFGFGALIGPVLASAILAINLGWNTFFWSLCLFWSLMGLGYWFFFNTASPVTATHKEEKASSANSMLTALKSGRVWLATIFLLVYVGVEMGFGTWIFTFLTEERHEDTVLSGWVVSGYWLGLTLGRIVLAPIAERYKLGNKGLIQLSLIGALLGIFILWPGSFLAIAAFGFWLVGFSIGPIYPTTLALLSELLPPNLLTNAIAVVTSISIMGAALFPWLVGILVQAFGLWLFVPSGLVMTVLMIVCWFGLRLTGTGTQINEINTDFN